MIRYQEKNMFWITFKVLCIFIWLVDFLPISQILWMSTHDIFIIMLRNKQTQVITVIVPWVTETGESNSVKVLGYDSL